MKQEKMLKHLCHLPEKIMLLKEIDNLPAYILYQLCHEECFDLSKVAYFVDNPDFDCLRGVAGVCKHEDCLHNVDPSKDPHSFAKAMNCSPFNTQVRNISRNSIRRSKEDDEVCMHDLAQELGFINPHYYSWEMKHDNYGVVLVEQENDTDWDEDYLTKSLYLLNFCPIP